MIRFKREKEFLFFFTLNLHFLFDAHKCISNLYACHLYLIPKGLKSMSESVLIIFKCKLSETFRKCFF